MDGNDGDFRTMTSYTSPPTRNQTDVTRQETLQSHPEASFHLHLGSFSVANDYAPMEEQDIYSHDRLSHNHQPHRTQDRLVSEDDSHLYGPSSSRYVPNLYARSHPEAYHPPQQHHRPPQEHYPPHVQLPPLGAPSMGVDLMNPVPSISPSGFHSVLDYHRVQTQQHAQALHHLTQARGGRDAGESLTAHENPSFSQPYDLGELPPPHSGHGMFDTTHATSSIPMSNNRQHQQRTLSLQHHLPRHGQFFDQQQYSYQHQYTQSLRYQQKHGSEDFDLNSDSHGLSTSLPPMERHQLASAASNVNVLHGALIGDHPSSSSTTLGSTTPSQEPTTSNPLSLSALPDILRPGMRSNATPSLSRSRSPSSFTSSAASPKLPLPTLKQILGLGNTAAVPKGRRAPRRQLKDLDVARNETTESAEEIIGLPVDEKTTPKTGRTEGTSKKEVIDTVTNDDKRSTGRGVKRDVDEDDYSPDQEVGESSKAALTKPSKKRKKSKMHECEVCYKKFPRPSGLRTHMNTHSNEKPYPCGFPGCNRTFGVRSNAKRHLRTHGVVPQQSVGAPPYVVDFSAPMILEQGFMQSAVEGDVARSDRTAEGSVGGQPAHRSRGRGRGRQFKLRWMPPSAVTGMSAGKGKAPASIASSSGMHPSPSRSPSRDRTDDPEEDEDAEEGIDDFEEDDYNDETEDAVGEDDEDYIETAATRTVSAPIRPVLSLHDPSYFSHAPSSSLADPLHSSPVGSLSGLSVPGSAASGGSFPPSASSSNMPSVSPRSPAGSDTPLPSSTSIFALPSLRQSSLPHPLEISVRGPPSLNRATASTPSAPQTRLPTSSQPPQVNHPLSQTARVLVSALM